MAEASSVLVTPTTITIVEDEEALERESSKPAATAPVSAQERISSVDALRGMAVLGILLMNILTFGQPMEAYMNPTVYGGDGGLNLAYWYANLIFFDGKMRTIFSMLFGAGVVLMTLRAEERGGGIGVADIYYRRTLWLILFGVLHAYFIWFGDILYLYGLIGLALFPLRKAKPSALLIAGLLLLLVIPVKSFFEVRSDMKLRERAAAATRLEAAGQQLTEPQKADKKSWEEKEKNFKPDPAKIKEDIERHRGGYWGLFVWRAGLVSKIESIWTYRGGIYDVGGMMLIGMALLMLGVFSAQRSDRFYWGLIALGYVFGATVNALVAWYFRKGQYVALEGMMALRTAYDLGRLTVALGHISVLMLLIKHGRLRSLTARLAAAGQMALTNYLMTSVLCVLFFDAFKMYGRLQRYQLLYVVFGVWLLMLVWSPIWLRSFRFGPMEWVWRSLTRWERQPLRLKEKVVVEPQPVLAD
jgi:uncharacterized protein